MTWHLRRYRNSRFWYARITRPDGVRGNWLSTREDSRAKAEVVAEEWDNAVIDGGSPVTFTTLRSELRDQWRSAVEHDSGKQRRVAKRLSDGTLVSGDALGLDVLADHVLLRSEPSGNALGCVLWTGGASKKGYGRFKMLGKLHSPHRVILERKIGRKMRRDEDTCHECDVPRCVNERHLFLGSRQDNVDDAMANGRHFIPGGWKPGEQGFVRVSKDSVTRDLDEGASTTESSEEVEHG
jgi:hypothetical protein